MAGQICQIFGRINSAFGHDGFACGHPMRKFAGGVECDLKGVEIAIVDANQGRLERKAALQFRRVMHFNQRIHAPGAGGVFQFCRLAVRDRGHDDQDTIGPQSAGFCDLIGVIHKVFAQRRQGCGGAGGGEIAVIALKGRPICQN